MSKSKGDLRLWLAPILRSARISATTLLFLNVTASLAHAHGGMAGPDELGPPLFTSAVLGFICYWIVILWPKAQSKDPDPSARAKVDSTPARRDRVSVPRRSTGVTSSSGPKRVAGRIKQASKLEGKANDV